MKSKGKVVRNILCVLLVMACFGGAAFFLKEPAEQYVEVKQSSELIQKEFGGTEKEEPKVDDLIEFNGDAVAWIRIEDTNINYPIVHSQDNKDYLRRNIQKQYSYGGTLFVDCRIYEPFGIGTTIVYGHNLNNGLMFSQLQNYSRVNWAQQHNTIKVYLKNGAVKTYKVFGYAKVNAHDTNIYDFTVDTPSELDEYYTMIDRYNIYDSDVPDTNHNILMLSTCTNINEDERYVVWAYDEANAYATLLQGFESVTKSEQN